VHPHNDSACFNVERLVGSAGAHDYVDDRSFIGHVEHWDRDRDA